MGIKGRKKEKQIQIIGGLFGILVAVFSLFYFFHAEKAQAEKRMVEIQPTLISMNLRNQKVFFARLKVPDR